MEIEQNAKRVNIDLEGEREWKESRERVKQLN